MPRELILLTLVLALVGAGCATTKLAPASGANLFDSRAMGQNLASNPPLRSVDLSKQVTPRRNRIYYNLLPLIEQDDTEPTLTEPEPKVLEQDDTGPMVAESEPEEVKPKAKSRRKKKSEPETPPDSKSSEYNRISPLSCADAFILVRGKEKTSKKSSNEGGKNQGSEGDFIIHLQ